LQRVGLAALIFSEKLEQARSRHEDASADADGWDRALPHALVGEPAREPKQSSGFRDGQGLPCEPGRRLRRLTQDEAASRLEPFLGVRWSKVTFSAAERSAVGGRPRRFDADHLVGLSLAFGLPPLWFLIPPESTSVVRPTPGAQVALAVDEFVDLLIQSGPVQERVREFPSPTREGARPSRQERTDDHVNEGLDELASIGERLRELASLAEELADRFGRVRAQAWGRPSGMAERASRR
jgi:hypothetical protein